MYLILNIFLLFNALHLVELLPLSQANIGCHQITKNNTSWLLIWQDTFASREYSEQQWNLSFLNYTCSEESLSSSVQNNQNSEAFCYNSSNVIHDERGFMILKTAYSPQNKAFGGAILDLKDSTLVPKSRGRWEVRASLPIGGRIIADVALQQAAPNGHQRQATQAFAREAEWSQFAQAVTSTVDEQLVFKYRTSARDILSEFHVFGFEWNEGTMRHFLDDWYGEQIRWNITESRKLIDQMAFSLIMGIYETSPERSFDELKWSCPAMIVDYVRLYEPVAANPAGPIVQSCPNVAAHYGDAIRSEICTRFALTETPSNTFVTRKRVVGIIAVKFVLLVITLLYCSRRKRTQISSFIVLAKQ